VGLSDMLPRHIDQRIVTFLYLISRAERKWGLGTRTFCPATASKVFDPSIFSQMASRDLARFVGPYREVAAGRGDGDSRDGEDLRRWCGGASSGHGG
jgi:hypothetical protein